MTAPGQRLGRYQVLEPLGSGGMSVVYKGLDGSLEREVAIKVLHPHLAQNPAARQRFAREARAVARLRHPNILEVFDISGEEAADAYLVTEYIRGLTLKDFLVRHPIVVPEAAALVVHAIASALAHAHQCQVVHRDVKPENVMVRDDGVVKLMDFGIAKVFDRDEAMTRTGTLVGSPAHMAPEIIAGEEARYPADVFSVGTLLFLLVVGELPFQGPNTPALLQRILEGRFDDPREKVPGLSDELAEVVLRCLEHRPEHRFADAGALAEALVGPLASVGLLELEEERLAFFADPEGWQAQLRQRIATARFARAQAALARDERGRALSELSLVLALVPDHGPAQALKASLQRRMRRRRRWATAAKALGVTALVAAAVFGVGRFVASPSGIRPSAAGPNERRPPPKRTALVPGEPVLRAARPEPQASAPEPTAAKPPPPSPVPVAVLVRPFGTVRIDGGAPSTEALARHALELTPGRHQLTVGCEYCEEVTEEVVVTPEGENTFRLRAQLKPATLAFRFSPVDARVRVAGEERRALDTREHPFRIESPRGPPTFRHRVEYEVTAGGFRSARRTVYLEPGKLTLVEGTLERS